MPGSFMNSPYMQDTMRQILLQRMLEAKQRGANSDLNSYGVEGFGANTPFQPNSPPALSAAPNAPMEMPEEQMQQQQSEDESQETPLESGAERGSQAARRSYEMDDEQKRRAMGHALMKMASSYQNSQNPSKLGAINDAFSPAHEAYMAQRDRMERGNRDAMKDAETKEYNDQILDLKKEELKLKKFDNMSGYQKAQVKNNLITRRIALDDKKAKALENFEKNTMLSGQRKNDAVAEKSAQLDRQYGPSYSAIENEAALYGMDLPQYPDDMAAKENEAVAIATAGQLEVSKDAPPTASHPIKVSKNGRYFLFTQQEAKAKGIPTKK